MRISQVRVQSFRCIHDVTLGFETLTAIIGSGGTGKSSFLRALEWFFRGGGLELDDVHERNEEGEVAVTVTFSDLDDADRTVLGRYATGEPTTFTRTWRPGQGDKLSGSALFYPGFDDIRSVGGVERRQRYRALVDAEADDLGLERPTPTRVAEVDAAMEQWEREHPELCELRPEDASHLFGFTGAPRLTDRFDYVLVGASEDAIEALGGGRGSPLSRLLSTLGDLDTETQDRIERLQSDAQREIHGLISSARAGGLRAISEGITRRVQEYVPQVAVELADEVAPVRPPDVSVSVQVRDQTGVVTDVPRQGHGLQRALVIALLHELAESSATLSGADGEATSPRSLMLAIEEPELYQHPLQARSLGQVLRQLASLPGGETRRAIQITYSTHSSHFVRPALYEGLRVFRRDASARTRSVAASPTGVAEALAGVTSPADIESIISKTLSSSLAEAVFARAVLLCEGTSDAAVMEAVAELDGGLDREGIAVVTCWGKTVIPVAVAILNQLEIPTYVLFDGDIELDERLRRKTSVSAADRAAQVSATSVKNRQVLELCGADAVDWPERAVRSRCANFTDRIESDLDELWPALSAARERIASNLGMRPKADEVYRRAVAEAGDPPEFLKEVLAAVRALLPT